jgi:hypothetical protein
METQFSSSFARLEQMLSGLGTKSLAVNPDSSDSSNTHRSHHLPPTRKSKNRLQINCVESRHPLLQHTDRFGDDIPPKRKKILRIGFQNIGGFPTNLTEPKEDFIRLGITNWEFDIFGLVETNQDWHTTTRRKQIMVSNKGMVGVSAHLLLQQHYIPSYT